MEETLVPGAHPVEEEVPLQRIITEVMLHSGVMSHAAARQIDASGYRIDERRTRSLQDEIEADRRERIAVMTEMVLEEDQEEFRTKIHEMLPDDLEARLKEAHKKAEAKWDKLSLEKDWDHVRSDLSAFRFSGEEITKQIPGGIRNTKMQSWRDWVLTRPIAGRSPG